MNGPDAQAMVNVCGRCGIQLKFAPGAWLVVDGVAQCVRCMGWALKQSYLIPERTYQKLRRL